MKVAVYTGTRNLYPHMIPAVKSLISNSDVDAVYLLIEDDVFPCDIPMDIVKTINVSQQKFFKPGNPNAASKFTYMAMIRVAFTKLLPDIDKVLSLDVDTIVRRDISDIWDIPLGNYCFAAVPEIHRSKPGRPYTNIGVCLQNLKMIRKDGLDDFMIDLLNKYKYTYLDQDVFNIYLSDRVYTLDSTYNANPWTEPVKNPHIKHYAGQREWFIEKDYLDYKALEWSDVFKWRELCHSGK